ncbi:MAG TPA: hypothetical protein VKM54_20305 [Myxococcota bacterium]|nr:hypothetical protein [Myxococcota bacterium]
MTKPRLLGDAKRAQQRTDRRVEHILRTEDELEHVLDADGCKA